jgi:hypothetical protein
LRAREFANKGEVDEPAEEFVSSLRAKRSNPVGGEVWIASSLRFSQ